MDRPQNLDALFHFQYSTFQGGPHIVPATCREFVSWIIMASSYQLESHKQQEEEWINSRTQSPHHNYHQCQGLLLKTARITY